MKFTLIIGFGSALGGMARYWISTGLARWLGEWLPWGTIAVNVTGSFLIGLIAALEAADGRSLLSPGIRLFFLIGLLGGFTTFSAFSLQTLALLQHEQYGRALANSAGSVLLCVAAAWVGHVAGGTLSR